MSAQDELLRDRLREWKQALTPAWRNFFGAVEPDLDALGDLKARESHPLPLKLERPRDTEDPVSSPHLTRAFDGLIPERVRVVILGQDPYPKKKNATGRAFEDGACLEPKMPMGKRRNTKMPTIATSLQRLLQSAASLHAPTLRIPDDKSDWDKVSRAIHGKKLPFPATPYHFDALAKQGVLFVNAAWTFTESETEENKYKDTHRKVWKPVMERMLSRLIQRSCGLPIVFLIFGDDALKLLQSSLRTACEDEIKDDRFKTIRMVTVYCAHPMSRKGPNKEAPNKTYFEYDNPLDRVNQALRELGNDEDDLIQWWPKSEGASSQTTAVAADWALR